MPKRIGLLTLLVLVSLPLASCGDSSGGVPTRTAGGHAAAPATPDPAGGTTAQETARAYLLAWEVEDGAALEGLLMPDARAAWAMGGGMSKRLRDKRRDLGSPIIGQGRVLQVEQQGGTGSAVVGVVYDCTAAGCHRYSLPDWPPQGYTASVDELTLQRQEDGRWLIGYLEGSSFLADLAQATRVVIQAATHTAAAVSRQQTRSAVPARTYIPTRTPVKR